jgi:hypothetical protein
MWERSPHLLFSVDCTGTDLGFQDGKQKNRQDSSQVREQARKLNLHVRNECSVQGNFQTAIDSLHDYNVAEQRRAETTRDDAYWGTFSTV